MIDSLVSVGCILLAAMLGAIGWVVKTLIDVKSDVASVRAQHKNNGGSTMKDAVDRIERTVSDLDTKVDTSLIDAARRATQLDLLLAERAIRRG